MLCQKSYSSFRLTLFSVHNIGGLCQHVPFGTLLDITHRHDGWCVLASLDVFPHGCVFASMDVLYIGYGRAPMISDVKCNPTIDQRTGYTSLLVFEKIFPRIAVIEQMFNDMTAATIHSNAGRISNMYCSPVVCLSVHIYLISTTRTSVLVRINHTACILVCYSDAAARV